MVRATLASLTVATLALSAQAATIHVPADYPTIRDGVNAATDGDSVLIACGVYSEFNLGIHKNIYVGSETRDPGCVVIDAGQLGRCISCSNYATIEGMTLSGGLAVPQGGGVFCFSGSPLLKNCIVSGNAASQGGGVYVRTGTSPKFMGCRIEGNLATAGPNDDGGGVYCVAGSAPVFQDCVIAFNRASDLGGGAFSRGATVKFVNCELTSNAAREGGALAADGSSTLSIESCRLSNNDGVYRDGLYVLGAADVGVLSSSFRGHASTAITAEGTSLFAKPRVGIDSCIFDSNGGGVSAWRVLELHIRNSTFVSNGGPSGNALFAAETPIRVEASQFVGNRRQWQDSGAIQLELCPAAVFHDCVFAKNTSSDGAVRYDYLTSPSFEYCIFSENSATSRGGAVSGEGSASAIFSNCSFYSNSSSGPPELAATLAFDAPGSITIRNVIIAGTIGGAAISCVRGAAPSVVCSDIFGNAAGDWVGCLADHQGTNGNFSADPLFCDAARGNVSLTAASPCLPGNHPDGVNCGVIGALDQGCQGLPRPLSLTPETWARIKASYR